MLFCVRDEAKSHETTLKSNGKNLSNVTADNVFFSIIASLEIFKNRRWLYMHISYFSLDKIYNTLNLVG